jgi:hypothetical protein
MILRANPEFDPVGSKAGVLFSRALFLSHQKSRSAVVFSKVCEAAHTYTTTAMAEIIHHRSSSPPI